jgi:FkbM family methyltransferase
MKKIINYILGLFDIKIVNNSSHQKNLSLLQKTIKDNADLSFHLLTKFSKNSLKLKNEYKNSHSQYLQDLFVLCHLNFKKKGYFVEIGAGDGVHLSNTILLEKKFKWNGILIEPLKSFFIKLKSRRKAKIETDLVYSISNKKLLFREVLNTENSSALFSTIERYFSNDFHSQSRKISKTYKLNTISLNDLLIKNNSPKIIDYLSIDTEGSEFEILKTVNFKKYKFRVITCEHNYSNNRKKINKLLILNGYKRVLEEILNVDDWYVYNKIL